MFHLALRLARVAGDTRTEAIVLGNIGVCYKNLGEYDQALRFHEQSLEMKRASGDREQEARTLSNIGQVYWKLADYDRALDQYRKALTIFEQQANLPLQAAVLNGISLVYDELGDYTRSRVGYERALALYERAGESESAGFGDALGNLGGVFLLLGRFEEAERRYHQSLQLSERLDDAQRTSLDHGNLGLCALGRGEFQLALTRFEMALKLATAAGLGHEEADWLKGRSKAMLLLGRYDDARAALDAAIRTYERAGLRRELVEALVDVGALELDLGDVAAAARDFDRAAGTARRIRYVRGTQAAWVGSGDVASTRGQHEQAAASYDAALQQGRRDGDHALVAEVATKLAVTWLRVGRDAEAAAAVGEALASSRAAGSRLLAAGARLADGELRLRRRELGTAAEAFAQAERDAKATGAVSVRWRGLYGLGRVREAEGDAEHALAVYREAVDVLEDVRAQLSEQRARAGFLQDKHHVYQALVRLLIERGRTGEAFEYSEQLRAQAYRDLFSAAPSSPLPHTDASRAVLAARIRHLQQVMDDEQRKPAAFQRRAAVATYSSELSEAEHAYASAHQPRTTPAAAPGRPDALDVDAVRRRLPAGTALLEYLTLQDGVAVFVLSHGQVVAQVLRVAPADLAARVELLRDLVSRPGEDTWVGPASSLYDLLIRPLVAAGWLDGITRCYIVPHGVLHYIPFAALRDREVGFVLGERFMLAQLPSAAALVSDVSPRIRTREGLLAVAPLGRTLPYAREEAEAVARLFAGPSTLLVGLAATETAFKEAAPQFPVIHLATHGALNRVNPLLSSLELGPDATNDGHLQVFEIVDLHLSARLVVLSACETGLAAGAYSNTPPGEEFTGLTQAFLTAGSRTVLASLWSISDRATVSVMRRFYERSGVTAPGAALRDVQRELKGGRERAHPYYWAPFVLIGPVL